LRAGAFDLLEAALEAWRDADPGAVFAGYFGYELAHELERLPPPPPDDLGLPDLFLGLYPAPCSRDGETWLGPPPESSGVPTSPPADLLPHAFRQSRLATRSRPPRDGFRRGVATIVDRIAAGEIFQANLCRRLEAPLPAAAAWPLYLALRAVSPARHGAFLNLGRGRALLSISPETFLSVRGRQVATLPIKGTRRRGASPAEDAALARELLGSEKERAELTMIVDVARNDLGRVCRAGSVRVESHAELMTLPTVHHTVSRVTGTLRDEIGPVELLRATFPPASISGAPKIRAMAVLGALEERRRGPAMGALGWIGCDGDLELSVAIRTAVAARGRIAYHAGCGIVADSDPQEELDESSAKARAFLAALGAAEAE
jgi:para-aminobenzoate synthetase component 1